LPLQDHCLNRKYG